MNGFLFLSDRPTSLQDLVITGPRIRLRTTTRDDAQEIFREFSAQITEYMIPKPAERIEETLEFIERTRERAAAGGNIQLTIESLEYAEFLGCCGLHGEGQERSPELGIWLKRSAHGHGYGREAIRLLCEWAFENLDLDHIVYPVDKRNLPSRKIPELLGATVIGKKRMSGMAGNELELVLYRIDPQI